MSSVTAEIYSMMRYTKNLRPTDKLFFKKNILFYLLSATPKINGSLFHALIALSVVFIFRVIFHDRFIYLMSRYFKIHIFKILNIELYNIQC